MLGRKVVIALMTILFVSGSVGIFEQAKGEKFMDIAFSKFISTSMSEEDISKRANRAVLDLFRDIDYIASKAGLTPPDKPYPNHLLHTTYVTTDVVLVSLDPVKRARAICLHNVFDLTVPFPDSETLPELSKKHFDEYVEGLKTLPVPAEPQIPHQISLKVNTHTKYDVNKKRVCTMIDEVCKELAFGKPALIKAMVFCESNFNKNSISSSGCEGLMQITPKYFRALMAEYDVDDLCEDERGNLRIGTHWMMYLLSKYGDDQLGMSKALVAYNCGESAVEYKEIYSTGYSKKILSVMSDYM